MESPLLFFEWEVEITDLVFQAINPLVSLIYFQLFMFHFILLCWVPYHASRLCSFFSPKLDYLFVKFQNLSGHIAFEFIRRKQMSIILMDLDKIKLYKADIIQSRDKDEKCIKDAWIQFAFDNILRVGDKVCFRVDFDLNNLFAEIVKHVP